MKVVSSKSLYTYLLFTHRTYYLLGRLCQSLHPYGDKRSRRRILHRQRCERQKWYQELYCKALGGYEANCTQQAEIWLQRPEGADRLLLANGQYRPTLTIDANTWVRLRLGFISSAQWL